jgi:hypothetical protein
VTVFAGTSRTRERELENCLRQVEFGRTDIARYRQFRLCLENMGPVFGAFGRYLSSRIDLVPWLLREELARIPGAAESTPPAEVRTIFSHETGCPPERAFREFDYEPFESGLFRQAHNAVLGDSHFGDTQVIVKIVHPDTGRRLADCDYLPILERPLAAFGVETAGCIAAMADFERQLQKMKTLEADLEATRLLARDAERFDLLGAPYIYRHLSGPHAATYRRWQSPDAGIGAADMARALCTVWMRQSLRGAVYPVEPCRDSIGIDRDGRVVFPSGPFATLPDAMKSGLWNYLVAVAIDDIDAAAAHLAGVAGSEAANSTNTDSTNEEFRRRIRRMDPFREGFRMTESPAWPADGPRFSETIFVHWKIVSEQRGMSEALVSFYRGLFAIAETAQSLAPGRDWLAEGMRDLRLVTAFDEVKEAARPSHMKGWLENYAESMVGMPERLDRFLTYAATGVPPAPATPPVEPDDNVDRSRGAFWLLLPALAAVGLFLHRIGASLGPRATAAGALVFLVFGLFVLRAGAR